MMEMMFKTVWKRIPGAVLSLAVLLSFGACSELSSLRPAGARSSGASRGERGPVDGRFHPAEGGLDEVRIQLLEAVITRDREAISRLLTPDFLWREDESPLEESPFSFWDRHQLWGELQKLIGAKVAKVELIRIAPREAMNPNYLGGRLAWRQVGGEWRLASYFPGLIPLR